MKNVFLYPDTFPLMLTGHEPYLCLIFSVFIYPEMSFVQWRENSLVKFRHFCLVQYVVIVMFLHVCLQVIQPCVSAVRVLPALSLEKALRFFTPSTWSTTWWQAAWSMWCGRTWLAGWLQVTTMALRRLPYVWSTKVGYLALCLAPWSSLPEWPSLFSIRSGSPIRSFASPPSSYFMAAI